MTNPFSPAPTDEDEVVIKINGKPWRFWDDLELSRSIDTYSTAAFTAPYDAKRAEVRNTFRPFSFAPVEITVGGDVYFTGFMLDVVPALGTDKRSVAVTCVAKPAVLLDSCAPASILPFEARGLTFKQVVDKVCKPFGLGVAFEGQAGAPFARVKQKLSGKVQGYFVELARERGFVLGDVPDGRLWVGTSTKIGRPVVRLIEGEPPLDQVTPTFNPREYFSEITGFVNPKLKRGAKFTSKNPRLHSVLRCDSFEIERADKADGPAIVRARMGRMFGNAFSVTVDMPMWRDPQGDLYDHNTTVKLTAPTAMVFTEYEFIVRTVTLRKNKDAKNASLVLVLPGAFSGEIPPKFPWD